MATIDLDYDENRGNTARPDCPLSIARDEDFFNATEHVMGYEEPEDGDAAYMIAPHISFERLVREGHVDDPRALNAIRLLPACVHVDALANTRSKRSLSTDCWRSKAMTTTTRRTSLMSPSGHGEAQAYAQGCAQQAYAPCACTS